MKKALISKLTIFIIILICAWYGKNLDTWGKNEVIKNDVISYYAYLPATFIFNDLTFKFMNDLPPDSGVTIWVETAPNGKQIIRMTMGMAILWIPFFLAAHGFAHLMEVSTLGYSWPYGLSIFLATLFYLFIGLLFLRKILIKYFSEIATSLTLILIVFATNLLYYVITESGMTHAYNFGLITAFIFYSMKWVECLSCTTLKNNGFEILSGNSGKKLKYTIILGLLAGIIVLIRPVNILVLLFPALIGINSFSAFRDRILKYWKLILMAGIIAFLVVLPQLIYWKIQTGHFLFNSYMDQGKFYFLKPQIINGLFSYRKGWLLYTPVMILALLGIIWLKKHIPGFSFPLILFLGINIYVVYSWWCWWYGGCYGSRPMIDIYGIMALPLAAFLDRIGKMKLPVKGIAVLVITGLIWLNQFQINQYRTSLLHWDSMTREAYWGIFGKKTWPEGYDKMIKVPDYEKALKGEKEY